MKKFLSCMLSLAMALSLAVPAFAAGAVPSRDDTDKVKVSGLQAEDEVSLYKLIEADYIDGVGFKEYVWNEKAASVIDGIEAGPIEFDTAKTEETGGEGDNTATMAIKGLNQDSLSKLGVDLTKLDLEATGTVAEGATEVEIPVHAGSYLVIVKPADATKLYNPMIVSCYYKVGGSDNTMQPGEVNSDMAWTLEGGTAYSKKTDMTMTKVIKDEGRGNDIGFDYEKNVGDPVSFQVDAVIPSYGAGYETVKVQFTDTMDTGLKFEESTFKVTYGGEEISPADIGTFTPGVNGFTFLLNSDWVLGQADKTATERAIVITYDATLTSEATGNFDYNRNRMVYEWSNNPQDSESTDKITDRTYTYTFDVNGTIYGEKINTDKKGVFDGFQNITNILVKVAAGENKLIQDAGNVVWNDTNVKWSDEQKTAMDVTGEIAGQVEFELYKVDDFDADHPVIPEGATPIQIGKNDSFGLIQFLHLDAGKYLFKESKAPDGFSLSEEVHTLAIEATYYTKDEANENVDEGMLKSVTFTIDKAANTFSATYTMDRDDDGNPTVVKGEIKVNEVLEEQTDTDVATVMNTRMGALPSTGGIGTTVFIAGGIIAMAIAAFVLMAVRKRKNED